eukprot:XP_011602320.1 PREDICTED: LYR motif-containing protein 1 isoform X1 [Takifugu rubripes]
MRPCRKTSSTCDECVSAGSLQNKPVAPAHFYFLFFVALKMASTRRAVLSLYSRLFRVARTWQAQTGAAGDTETERKYIVQEARTLFRQNQQLTDPESIWKCIKECEARIEIGLHYRNPYPRAVYLPPLGLATQKGRRLRAQQRLRKQAKPIYLQSQDET